MEGGVLPVDFDAAYQVLLNKTELPIVTPCQTRPLVLQNCIAKIVPSAINRCLAQAAPQVLHGAQYGFISGRSIPQAACHLEELVLKVANCSKFSTLLFTDLQQAFPTLRRGWTLLVCNRSGAGNRMMRLLRQLLRPSKIQLKWRQQSFKGFSASTGLKQGDPLSGLVFALSIDCFIRWSSYQLPDCIELGRQVWFADDTVQLLCTRLELEIAAVLFAVLFDASGMQFGPKSKFLFVGSASETEFRAMVARLGRGHIFADLPIV
eukprot:6472321-Amphidinium_carterae.1